METVPPIVPPQKNSGPNDCFVDRVKCSEISLLRVHATRISGVQPGSKQFDLHAQSKAKNTGYEFLKCRNYGNINFPQSICSYSIYFQVNIRGLRNSGLR